jgi:hypothetical protein
LLYFFMTKTYINPSNLGLWQKAGSI